MAKYRIPDQEPGDGDDRVVDVDTETYLRWLETGEGPDPALGALQNAPPDSEPYTPDQQAIDRQAVTEAQRDGTLTTDEVSKLLALDKPDH